MGVELDERYQVEAYEAIKKGIKEKGSAGIVLPTGTGKTYLALKLIEDNLDKQQILYVSPSPKINVEVRKAIQSIYPPKMADKILSKVKFTTYSGLYKRYSTHNEDMQEYNSDIMIFDEAHRAGAKKWKQAVKYLREKNKQAGILAMTATPSRTDGKNVMEEICGKIDYELKMSESVARGILKVPTYISARHIFTEDMESMQEKITAVQDERVRKKLQKELNKLRKQVENAKGLKEIYNKYLQRDGRYLIFCNPGDNIEELQKKAKTDGDFDDINEEQTYLRVEASRTNTENTIALRDFCRKSGNDLRLLYSKNMLNEGIHNEDITGEIMLRSTKSYILFLQQLGRVLRRDNEKDVIVLDLVGNIRYFKEFRIVIQQIVEKGISRGKRIYNPKVLESFRILEEQEEFIESFKQIEEQLASINAVSRFISKLKELQALGVDFTKITSTDTIETLAKKSGIAEEVLQEAGFDISYKIGIAKSSIAQAYRGKGNVKPPTEEEMQQLEELGVNLEYRRSQEERKKSTTQIFIDKLSRLQVLGVDVTKITQKDTIETLAKKSGIAEEVLQEAGFDISYKIGIAKKGITYTYRGKVKGKLPTKEEVQQLEELGVNLEYKSATEIFIDKLSKLQNLGVDVTKVTQADTIKTLAKKSGIAEEVLQEAGFDISYKIGNAKVRITKAYRGKGTVKPPTEEEIQQLEKFGVNLEYKSATEIFIDKLSKLQNLGVDVTKVTQADTIKTLAKKSGIAEEVLQEAGFDISYKIGNAKVGITKAYRGKGTYKPPTEEEVQQLEKLGISLERKRKTGQEIGQATFDVSVEKCDEAQNVISNLTKRRKESKNQK